MGLFAAFITFAVLFVIRERAAADPVLSMSLFGSLVFCAVNVVSFVSGVALFAVLTFVPQYLQVVHEVTATRSGLLLLPFLVGVVTCSVGSGIVISRTGAYRLYPVVGTALMTAEVVLLSQVGAATSQLRFGVDILIFRAGLGLFIQILILVAQNVLPSSLGVATSAVTFFRTLGGAIGASALGALHASALTDRARQVPPHALDPIGGQAGLALGPRELAEAGRRAPGLHEAVASIYAHAAGRVFLWVIPVGVVSIVAAVIAARDSRALRTDLYYEPIESVI